MAKYELETSNKFEKQFKKLHKKDKEAVSELLEILINDEPLEPRHNDHALLGGYKG